MRIAALVIALMTMTTTMLGQTTKKNFGKMPDGTPIEIYTLKDGLIEADVITYGGIIQSLKVPDKSGKVADMRERLAADFRGWETNNTIFETQLERLVRALRADDGGREAPPPSRL